MDWFLYDCVHLGIKPLQKHHPLFFAKPLLNLQTVPALPHLK